MATSYQYRGDLAETTLPEMLARIDRFAVAGRIEARRGSILKEIQVRDGQVVRAVSNDLADSLGAYLERAGRLSAEETRKLTLALAGGRKRLGALLVERDLFSPIEVYEAIRHQIEAIVWSLFDWREGEVVFSVGEVGEDDRVRIQLPMRRVIFQGIRRAADARPLLKRLGRKETILAPSYRAEDLIEIGLDADEVRLLRLADGSRSLYEICSQGPFSPADNAKRLYAFQVLRLLSGGSERRERSQPLKIRLRTEGDRFVPS